MSGASAMNVVIYLDEGYAVPATVMVRSLLENLGQSPPVQLHVLGLGLGDATKRTMAASWPSDRLTIDWIDVEWRDYAHAYQPTGYLSSAAYARLLIDRYLPPDVDKVLTIDSDGVVLGDIAEVWRLSPRRACLMAVQDSFVRVLADDGSGFIQNDRACHVAPYFNSGLMLIDMKRWRNLGVARRCLELAARHPGEAIIGDNSLLNAVLVGDWERLPLRWNCSTRHLAIHDYPSIRGQVHPPAEVTAARRDPGFLHFVSRRKPWNTRWYHPDRDVYARHLARTVWGKESLARGGVRWSWGAATFGWLCYRQAAETRARWRIGGRRAADFVHFMSRSPRMRLRNHTGRVCRGQKPDTEPASCTGAGYRQR